MKTNNRPMIKVTEYELQWKASKKMYWKELNAENTDWSDNQTTQTGNTRIIERPMNDAEYIEYLENSIELFGFERARDDKLSKEIIVSLRKQNQDLKDKQLEDKKLINKLNYDLEHYGENRTLAGRPIYVDKQVSEIIDRQYKELLEKDNIIIGLQEKLMDRDFSNKNYQEYLRIETEYQCLLANNNELKEYIEKANKNYFGTLDEKYKDQFLKIVEDVFMKHYVSQLDENTFTCACNVGAEYNGEDYDLFLERDELHSDNIEELGIETHIFQEIKNAMEKEGEQHELKTQTTE